MLSLLTLHLQPGHWEITAGTSETVSTEKSGFEGGGLSLGGIFLSFHLEIFYIYIHLKIHATSSFSVDKHLPFLSCLDYHE